MSLVDKMTGKCREDFEKWYIPYIREQRTDYLRFSDESLLRKFDRSIPPMQFGVIVDFAETSGVHITMIPHWKSKEGFSIRVGFHVVNNEIIDSHFLRPDEESPFFKEYKTRLEAREAATKEFNRIYNEQNK